MSKINVSRVLLGGIVAGIVADALDYPVDGMWLSQRWSDGLHNLGVGDFFTTQQFIEFDLLGIVGGIVAIWLYAAIRPRFGPGLKTAVLAGIAVWILTAFLPNVGLMYVTELFGRGLTVYTTLGALVEIVVGTAVGAYLYKED